jgi:hypothetical protein
MTNKFDLVFRLSIFNPFYTSNECTCLVFSPDDVTNKVLVKYNFVVRTINNGIELFIQDSSKLVSLLDYIQTVTGLSAFKFDINTSDPNFYNFTNLPFNDLQSVSFSTNQKNSDGTLKINISNEAPKLGTISFLFEDLKGDLPKSYSIKFANKHTQWRYYVVQRSGINLSNPIVTGSDGSQFESPISTKIETGDSALLFVSSATIPMKERSEVTYNLVDKITVSTLDNSVKNRTIFKGLPISSPEAIMLDNSTVPPLFSSPIYIYI